MNRKALAFKERIKKSGAEWGAALEIKNGGENCRTHIGKEKKRTAPDFT